MAAAFSIENFVKVMDQTCEAIRALYSEENTIACVTAFYTQFNEGVILWRTSDEYCDSIKYRFYTASPINALDIAINAQFFDILHPLMPALQKWLEPWTHVTETDNVKTIITPEQRCEFDSLRGLTSICAFMGRPRPIEEVITLPDVPEDLLNYYHTFLDAGLRFVRKITVDFFDNTVTLHFEPRDEPYSRADLDTATGVALNTSRMLAERYDKTDLARVVPKPVVDIGRTLEAGYTFEITFDLKVRTRVIYVDQDADSDAEFSSDDDYDFEVEYDEEEHDEEEYDEEEHDGEEHDGEEYDEEEYDEEEHDVEEQDGEEHDGEEPHAEEHHGEERHREEYSESPSEITFIAPPSKNPSNPDDTEPPKPPSDPIIETIVYTTGAISNITLRAHSTQHIALPRLGARLYKFMDLHPNFGGEYGYLGLGFVFRAGDFRFTSVERVLYGRLGDVGDGEVGYGSGFEGGWCGVDVLMDVDGEGEGSGDGDEDEDVEMAELTKRVGAL